MIDDLIDTNRPRKDQVGGGLDWPSLAVAAILVLGAAALVARTVEAFDEVRRSAAPTVGVAAIALVLPGLGALALVYFAWTLVRIPLADSSRRTLVSLVVIAALLLAAIGLSASIPTASRLPKLFPELPENVTWGEVVEASLWPFGVGAILGMLWALARRRAVRVRRVAGSDKSRRLR